jgi:hypothetical protein
VESWTKKQYVYFGHDAKRGLQAQSEFACGLDTGCCYGRQLSAMVLRLPESRRLVQVDALRVYEEVSQVQGGVPGLMAATSTE